MHSRIFILLSDGWPLALAQFSVYFSTRCEVTCVYLGQPGACVNSLPRPNTVRLVSRHTASNRQRAITCDRELSIAIKDCRRPQSEGHISMLTTLVSSCRFHDRPSSVIAHPPSPVPGSMLSHSVCGCIRPTAESTMCSRAACRLVGVSLAPSPRLSMDRRGFTRGQRSKTK